MKTKAIIVTALTGIIMAGCNTHEQDLANLSQEKDSLLAVTMSKDQSMNEFISSFSEIESNLAAITEKQNIIASTSEKTENIKSVKEQINAQINEINDLMSASKAKLKTLNAKILKSNVKIANFEKLVTQLNNQIAEKDKEMIGLNEQIALLNNNVNTLKTSVDELNVKNDANAKIIEDQTNKMNTAYILVGDYKNLKEKKVINRQGGVLGMGKTETLDPEADKEAFSTIDISKIVSIPLNTKDVKLVTAHPKDSYRIEREEKLVSELVITNPEKFWSESKYLVLMTN